jgi:cell division septation protein DedD
MTTSRHLAAPLRSRRRLSIDRIISTGLAVTACAGMVAVIGVRSIEDSAATQQAAAVDATAGAVSSTGLTEAQLDEYAAQLQAEGARLDSYRDKLATVAGTLTTAPATQQSPAAKPKPKAVTKPAPVAKPTPKPAPKPAAKPQSTTKSS